MKTRTDYEIVRGEQKPSDPLGDFANTAFDAIKDAMAEAKDMERQLENCQREAKTLRSHLQSATSENRDLQRELALAQSRIDELVRGRGI